MASTDSDNSVQGQRKGHVLTFDFTSKVPHAVFRIDQDDYRIASGILSKVENDEIYADPSLQYKVFANTKMRDDADDDDSSRVVGLCLEHTGVSDEAFERSFGTLKELVHLTNLKLGLKSLPPKLWELKNLTHLTLVNLRHLGKSIGLSSLPPEISQLQNLQVLECMHLAHMIWLPEEIGDLTSLKRLDLRGAGIESLPSSIGRLRNLRELRLDETKNLRSLPEELGNLENLEQLNLCGSLVSKESLPECIGRLKRLRRLLALESYTSSYEFQEYYPPLEESFFKIVGRCKVLGSLCFHDVYFDDLENTFQDDDAQNARFHSLNYALACNRARSRTGFGIKDDDKYPEISQNLWPEIIASAVAASKYYKFNSQGWLDASGLEAIPQPDAIHRLLVIGQESFLRFLVSREKNRGTMK